MPRRTRQPPGFDPLGPPPDPTPNPRPKAWKQKGPDTEYACEPWEGAWLGRGLPRHGRDAAGVVVACATPTRRKPKEGQIVVETPKGAKYHVTRNVAKLRARDRTSRTSTDPETIRQNIAEGRARVKRGELPIPPGIEYPHRRGSSKCDPEHPSWGQLGALGEFFTVGDPAFPPGATAKEKRALREKARRAGLRELRSTDEYRTAVEAQTKCAQDFEQREDLRHASRGSGRDRDAREWRREYLARGGDPTAAEYLEQLSPGSRAKRLRDAGRVTEARALERETRARKAGKAGGFRGAFAP